MQGRARHDVVRIGVLLAMLLGCRRDTSTAPAYLPLDDLVLRGLAVSPPTIVLVVGDTATLTAVPLIKGDYSATWVSSVAGVVRVDSLGRLVARVRGVQAGTVSVTATLRENAGLSASALVTVR